MIVRVVRPVFPPHGAWLLYAPGVIDTIEPTAQLVSRMSGMSGYFEAFPEDDGWDIREAVDDPHWRVFQDDEG